MTVDRLSALDECFLRMESDAAHMHVGWTLLAEGAPPSIEELRAHVLGRLELVPRFRRRVLSAPYGTHDSIWVDDPQFDVAEHVRQVRMPSAGGMSELRELAGRLLSAPLDRARPLWRMHLIEGLDDTRFALVGQAHHALLDGIAAVQMALLLLDVDPAGGPAPSGSFVPEPPPRGLERVLASAGQRARIAGAAGGLALRALAHPSALGETATELRRVGSALAAIGTPAPATLLNGPICPERSVAFADLSLEAARELGRARGATVGDVVLATAALALGRYLRRGGEAHPWLRVMVPVSTRRSTDSTLGNRVSAMFVELPVGERNPRAALEEVARQSGRHKRAAHPAAIEALLRASAMVPAQVRDAFAWLLTRPQTFNVVVSNIPGPREPMYLRGRPLEAAYPAVPLMRAHGLSVGVLSYRKSLHVGLYADPGVVPEVVELARDFDSSFDALRLALAPRRPRPRAKPTRTRRALSGMRG